MQLFLKAFSLLRPHLKRQGIGYLGEPFTCKDGITLKELIATLGFGEKEVEGAFVNHLVVPKTTVLKEGDKVALIPPGTPGSYRLILGIKENA
ncbi:MAG: MoaD/ThiS family protein [Campylobacterales bacterium]|nr:MoaD/ThiS family protein [Campylobacterales bacterium]